MSLKTAAWLAAGVTMAILASALWLRTADLRAIEDHLRTVTRDRDSAALRAADIEAQREVSERELRRAIEDATERSSQLRAEIARIQKAVPTSRPTGSVQATTGAVTIPQAPPRPLSPQPPPPSVAPCPISDCQRPEGCLCPGDSAEIRASAVSLESDGGAKALAMTAELWRLTPPPKALILAAPLRVEADGYLSAPLSPPSPPRPRRWGFGLVAGAGTDGLFGGPAVSPPPLPVLRGRAHLELLFGGGVGPSYNGALFVTGLVRF